MQKKNLKGTREKDILSTENADRIDSSFFIGKNATKADSGEILLNY